MVSQKCKRCKDLCYTNLNNLSNYCKRCGSQNFILRAETQEEQKHKIFTGKRSVSFKGKRYGRK